MSEEVNIVPFGKYKGRLIEEVIADDPNYLQWLSGQDWFRAKFTTLYQVIINRGAEPAETPEHNALQVRFLDDEFCLAFLRQLPRFEQKLANAREWIEDHRQREYKDATTNFERARGQQNNLAYASSRDGGAWARSELEQWCRRVAEIERRLPLLSEPGKIQLEIEREFEVRGVDVVLALWLRYEHVPEFRHMVFDERLCIELKPAVSDDYPAVLRQMKPTGAQFYFLSSMRGGAQRASNSSRRL
jgi:uncharacterized protein (DUF3820 family)